MTDNRSNAGSIDRVWKALSLGDIETAVQITESLTQRFPGDPNGWFLFGVAESQRNRPAEALQHLRKTAALDNQFSTVWHRIGNALIAVGDLAGAVDAYIQAITTEPSNAWTQVEFLRLLAMVQGHPNHITEAMDRWLSAFAVKDLRDGVEKLERLFSSGGGSYDERVFIEMARVLHRMGMEEDAINCFSITLRNLAEGRRDLDTDHNEIINIYSQEAESYEQVKNAIVSARELADLTKQISGQRSGLRMLDAGCGTGLMGSLLMGIAWPIVGIDMTAEMLAKAELKGDYDELVKGEMVDAMKQRSDSFDLITSSLVLYMIGDLSDFFAVTAERAAPNALLAFNVFPCLDRIDIGYSHALGYFAHSRQYLRRVAKDKGWEAVAMRVSEHGPHSPSVSLPFLMSCVFRAPKG